MGGLASSQQGRAADSVQTHECISCLSTTFDRDSVQKRTPIICRCLGCLESTRASCCAAHRPSFLPPRRMGRAACRAACLAPSAVLVHRQSALHTGAQKHSPFCCCCFTAPIAATDLNWGLTSLTSTLVTSTPPLAHPSAHTLWHSPPHAPAHTLRHVLLPMPPSHRSRSG